MKIRHIAEWVFVLSFGVFVFFVGWTQWRVGAGKVGIVTSKTGGICDTAVLPGVFSWHWEFLLPTNAVLATYPVGTRVIPCHVSGSLPSGDVYGAALSASSGTGIGSSPSLSPLSSLNVDFTYSIDMEVTTQVTADDILHLVSSGTITNESSLADYIDSRADAAAKRVGEMILKGAEIRNRTTLDYRSDDDIDGDTLLRHATTADGDNLITHIRIVSSELPDTMLYNTLREQYVHILQEAGKRATERKMAVQRLISEYPELEVTDKGSEQTRQGSTSLGSMEYRVNGGGSMQEQKRIRAIRGATVVSSDDASSMTEAVGEMCTALFARNGLTTEDIVSCVFSQTDDIHSTNSATALRRSAASNMVGSVDVSAIPLFCAAEPRVDGMMPLVVRVIVTAYMPSDKTITPVYINGAQKLRPDL